jgi:hypothetical protein
MTVRNTLPDDEKLARATLLALRMTLRDPDEGGDLGYCLLPHRAPLALPDITSALVAMKKPITCIGVGVGGLLGVGCWPLPVEDARARQEMAPRIDELNAATHRRLVGDSGSANVLLTGFKENLLLSWNEYIEWQQQYFLYTLQSNMRTANSQQRAMGAHAVIEIYGIRKDGSSGGGMTKPSPYPNDRQ